MRKPWSLPRIVGALLVPPVLAWPGAVAGQGPSPGVGGSQPSARDQATGRELFGRYCAGCHGEDGRGEAKTFRPSVGNLAVKQLMDQVPDDYLFTVIKEGGAAVGKNAAMPAWRSQLDDDQIRDLVAFIRTLARY